MSLDRCKNKDKLSGKDISSDTSSSSDDDYDYDPGHSSRPCRSSSSQQPSIPIMAVLL